MRIILCVISLLLILTSCVFGEVIDVNDKSPVFNQRGNFYSKNNNNVIRYDHPKTIDKSEGVINKLALSKPVKIALLIPMTGKYSEIGKNLLDAAQLALFSINSSDLTLLPIDTKETAYEAVEAANKAVAENVNIILGPVFGKSAIAIAKIAKENNINIISFSNDKSLAGTGVFALGIRPEEQISRIVNFAAEKEIEDFAAIVPSNTYGAAVAEELRKTVSSNNNASVLQTAIYRDINGKPIDVSKSVEQVFTALMNNISPENTDETLKFINHNSTQPPKALLIPEGGEQLKEISGYLNTLQYNRKDIQLLGTSAWYDDTLLNNPILEGAWFVTAPKERRVAFEEKFSSTFNYKPHKLASLAYDGIALAATVARLSDGSDFSHDLLLNRGGFMGVDGIFRFTKEGLTERGLEIMQINNGRFETISPAPTRFYEAQ